jgi:hypothetical protein
VQRLCALEINKNNPWEKELPSVVQNDAEAEEIHPSVSFADAISQPEENQPELLQDVPQDVQKGGTVENPVVARAGLKVRPIKRLDLLAGEREPSRVVLLATISRPIYFPFR